MAVSGLGVEPLSGVGGDDWLKALICEMIMG